MSHWSIFWNVHNVSILDTSLVWNIKLKCTHCQITLSALMGQHLALTLTLTFSIHFSFCEHITLRVALCLLHMQVLSGTDCFYKVTWKKIVSSLGSEKQPIWKRSHLTRLKTLICMNFELFSRITHTLGVCVCFSVNQSRYNPHYKASKRSRSS